MKKKSNFDILMIMFGFTFFSGSMLIGQTLSNGLNLIDLYLGISEESRNLNLANIFYRLKYVENFGTGIVRIIGSYNDFDKKTVFVDTDNAFNVTLYNVNYLEKN